MMRCAVVLSRSTERITSSISARNSLLLVSRARRRCEPHGGEIGTEGEQAFALLLSNTWTLLQAACELSVGSLTLDEALLPIALQAASDESVLGIDSAIATLGPVGLVGCPFGAEPPLLERNFGVVLQPLGGGQGGSEPGRFEGGKKRLPSAASICTPPTLRQ
jgi:hypothetical protein